MTDVPKPPDTSPRGGARVKPMTEHQMIDIGEMTKRTADKVNEMGKDWPRVMRMVKAHERLVPVVELAMRPIPRTRYEKAALPVIAVCAIVFVLTYLAQTSSAKVPEPSPRVQASR